MARVYGLKRATPKMKYIHMTNMLEWKADLREEQDAEALRRADELQEKFVAARDELKEIDPTGWEAWYDDNRNVPNFRNMLESGPAIEAMQKRVAELKTVDGGRLTVGSGPSSPLRSATLSGTRQDEQFNWKVASANTLRGYAAAAKDFETATSIRVDRADFESMQTWHEGMKRRGLAPNTIRTRIAAVRILSGVQYPLPGKTVGSGPSTALRSAQDERLTLEQVQAVLKQARGEERSALVLALTTGGSRLSARRDSDFRAYFLGDGKQMTAQSLTRLIKRCAAKAGISAQVSLRTWTRSGAALLKAMNPAEFSAALPKADLPEGVDWASRLHGIGRRSKHLSKA